MVFMEPCAESARQKVTPKNQSGVETRCLVILRWREEKEGKGSKNVENLYISLALHVPTALATRAQARRVLV